MSQAQVFQVLKDYPSKWLTAKDICAVLRRKKVMIGLGSVQRNLMRLKKYKDIVWEHRAAYKNTIYKKEF